MADATFGKYRLLAELGHGGMADVFLAVAAGPVGSGFSKLTVIKRLRQNLADDPEFVAMLVDEARIAARLNHPNVVQTNEVGEVNGQYYISMEYLDGQPLHRVQYRVAKESTPTVTNDMQYLILMDALAGLHHAHELRDYDGASLDIVHRDVTPHNLFVTYEGQVKVVDFGIAKAAGRSSETRQGVVKGKVRYMAPEQAIGQTLDRRADLFAMGILVWEVATGRRMWKDADDLQIVRSLVAGDVPISPRKINPDVPEALDKICQRALAHRAEDRYATAEEFRTELEQFLADTGALVTARRKLGPKLGELFKDRRTELKEVVERQLGERGSGPGSGPASSTAAGAPARPVTVTDEATMSTPYGAKSTSKPTSKRLLWSALVAAAALGTGGWVSSHRAAAPATVGSTTPDQAARTEIVVSLKAEPANAVIKLDDRAVGNAFESRVPRDGKEHRVDVSAEGFTSKVETLTFGADLQRQFHLEKAAASVPAAATTAVPSATGPAPTARRGEPPPSLARATPPTTTTEAPPAVTADPILTVGRPPDGRKKRELDKTDPWGNATP